MPPAGSRRPDQAGYATLTEALESALDRVGDARAEPRPAKRSPAEPRGICQRRPRSSRRQHRSALLFACRRFGIRIRQHRGRALCFARPAGSYLVAAGRIARLAVADPSIRPGVAKYRVPLLTYRRIAPAKTCRSGRAAVSPFATISPRTASTSSRSSCSEPAATSSAESVSRGASRSGWTGPASRNLRSRGDEAWPGRRRPARRPTPTWKSDSRKSRHAPGCCGVRPGAGARRGCVPAASADCQLCLGEQDRRRTRHRHHRDSRSVQRDERNRHPIVAERVCVPSGVCAGRGKLRPKHPLEPRSPRLSTSDRRQRRLAIDALLHAGRERGISTPASPRRSSGSWSIPNSCSALSVRRPTSRRACRTG